MDYATEFVNQFCDRLAVVAKSFRSMASWYVFSDKRPGTIEENFAADAKEHSEYEEMKKI